MKPMHLAVIFSVAALTFIARPAGAQETPAAPPADASAGIVVQGTGEVQVRPDLARLNLGVQNQAKDSTAAAEANAALTAKVVEAIKRAGVAERDIQTAGYSIYPQYESRPRPGAAPGQDFEQVLVGYQVSNTVRVTVRKIGDTGRVLDAAVKAGANVAQGIAFDLDVPTATRAREEALRLAVADALRKAKVIAEAAGIGPIRLVAVVENGAGGVRPVYESLGRVAFAKADQATPVQPGENTVTASVTVRYRFAGGAASAATKGTGSASFREDIF